MFILTITLYPYARASIAIIPNLNKQTDSNQLVSEIAESARPCERKGDKGRRMPKVFLCLLEKYEYFIFVCYMNICLNQFTCLCLYHIRIYKYMYIICAY